MKILGFSQGKFDCACAPVFQAQAIRRLRACPLVSRLGTNGGKNGNDPGLVSFRLHAPGGLAFGRSGAEAVLAVLAADIPEREPRRQAPWSVGRIVANLDPTARQRASFLRPTVYEPRVDGISGCREDGFASREIALKDTARQAPRDRRGALVLDGSDR